jgi:glucose-1-phosphate thymidylyltransferase
VVTNARKAPAFREWASGRDVTIHDDGTTSNDDRLGAIGDMQFVVDRIGADDDLLVIAGDNLFDFRLGDLVAFWGTKGVASAVAVRDVGSLELARRYGIVALDSEARIRSFVEKPEDPNSTLAATATYVFHRDHVRLIRAYLDSEPGADQPGRFVAWLQQREPVYGWVFAEQWFDIGDHEQLLEADNLLRTAAGLLPRAVYDPS